MKFPISPTFIVFRIFLLTPQKLTNMRKFYTILALMSLYVASAFAQIGMVPIERPVTLNEALSLVTAQYESGSVDVFLKEDVFSWVFFVDEEPMKGWEHACCLKTIPKKVKEYGFPVSPYVTTQRLRIPPSGEMEPVSVHNRYGANANHKPRVAKKNLSASVKEAARRTYAIILSGGICPIANAERYWNDCSFIYQTLVNTYGVPKANIYPIISDGNDPGKDMMKPDGTFVSSPLDLDFDGQPDIYGNARRETVENALNELKLKMNDGDQLFFYVIDHGSKGNAYKQSYINMWDYQELYDDEVANWTKPLVDKGVSANFVFGQCFSGGFVDELTKIGCVVATACNYDEYSYALSSFPYDEFVYHWTCAVNGATPFSTKTIADYDGNGHVSMEEAFKYAKAHDSFAGSMEHPQYVSTPIYLGKDLAFDYLPESGPDLFIRDNDEDFGLEPNTTTEVHWDSPDIWIRKESDWVEEHQNPSFRTGDREVWVYVKITNRGTKQFNGGKWLHLYWADASTAITPRVWVGMETNSKGDYTGGEAGRSKIPSIKPGETIVVPVSWIWQDVSRLNELTEHETHHFCLSAKISDEAYQEPYYEGMSFNAGDFKTIAQKNLTVLLLDGRTVSAEGEVYVRNIANHQKNYSLEIRERRPKMATSVNKGIYDVATVDLTMSSQIYNAWQRGGCRSKGIDMPASATPQTVTFTSNNDVLQDLKFNASEFERVAIKVKLKDGVTKYGRKYKFDLIQRDEAGNVVGGETFQFNEGWVAINPPITIDPIVIGDGMIMLNAAVPEDNVSVNWTDEADNRIGRGSNITVKPTRHNDTFTVTVFNDKGEMSEGSITLEPTFGIKSASPALVEDVLDIELLSATGSPKSEIIISPINRTEVQPMYKALAGDETSVSVVVSTLPTGVYVVTLTVDGKAIDSVKFNKK